jgi:hypothetical protein
VLGQADVSRALYYQRVKMGASRRNRGLLRRFASEDEGLAGMIARHAAGFSEDQRASSEVPVGFGG